MKFFLVNCGCALSDLSRVVCHAYSIDKVSLCLVVNYQLLPCSCLLFQRLGKDNELPAEIVCGRLGVNLQLLECL